MKFIAATNNPHKLKEMRSILESLDIEVVAPKDIGGIPEVEEDGLTFEANAGKKAVLTARATGEMAVADDSGLECFAIGGAPGVYSARYAGEDADDAAKITKLLDELDGGHQASGHQNRR